MIAAKAVHCKEGSGSISGGSWLGRESEAGMLRTSIQTVVNIVVPAAAAALISFLQGVLEGLPEVNY